jgi:hypothetical protein
VNDTRRSLRTRFRERRYTPAAVRIGLGCALIGAVCLVELGSTSGADTSFVPGNAQAQSQAISLAPTTGGLSYAITLATSISGYQDTEAQSLSQTVDLGAIGTSLEAEGCSGGPPTVNQSQTPQPVQVESTSGNASGSDNITNNSSASGLGTGAELASVTTQPSSDALTTMQNVAVPGGLFSISGLTSQTHASIDNGATRTATATADIASLSLGDGLVVLGHLHWSAENQTGAASTSTGTFSIGALTIGGVAVPTSTLDSESPQTVLNVINTALAPIGINVVWPASTTLPDGTIEISPMQIGIDNNALGQEVVGTNLGSVQAERTVVVNALLNANCNTADAFLVGDIATGVAAGGGNMNVLLGGASALTNDDAEVDPFGPAGAPPAPAVSTSLTGNSGNSGSGAGGVVGNSGAALPSTPVPSLSTPSGNSGSATPAATSAGASPKESLGPIQKTDDCFSLGPAGGGCYQGNVGVPVGLGVIAILSGLFTWDYMRQKRRGRFNGGPEVTQ